MKEFLKPCVILVTNRADNVELDATLNVEDHLWLKIRSTTRDDGHVKRDGNGARVNRSFEFNRLTDGLSDSAVMSYASSDASVPTVVGRVRDLGDDHMVGMRVSELFARAYQIPYGPDLLQ